MCTSAEDASGLDRLNSPGGSCPGDGDLLQPWLAFAPLLVTLASPQVEHIVCAARSSCFPRASAMPCEPGCWGPPSSRAAQAVAASPPRCPDSAAVPPLPLLPLLLLLLLLEEEEDSWAPCDPVPASAMAARSGRTYTQAAFSSIFRRCKLHQETHRGLPCAVRNETMH